MKSEDFIRELFENQKSLQLTASIHAVSDDEALRSLSIYELLNLDKNRVHETGQKIIDILEKDKDFPDELYIELKWKILALITIQDAFRGIMHADGQVDSMFSKSYFYYESLHLLREYFYCGFNNLQVSAQHLLRTIVEFSIKQNYFDYVCTERGSFVPIEKYLDNGITPAPAKMLSAFLPKDKLAKPLKKRVHMVLKGLSNSTSHAYAPIHSVRGSGKLQHEYSVDSLFFWTALLPILDTILWMYYFYQPQLFNPKDSTKKFGFSPPVGCFINDKQHVAIKRSLNSKDYDMFIAYANNSYTVKSLNEFYESQPDMTDDEVMATWDSRDNEPKKPESIEAGYFRTVVQMRAMQEVLANHCAMEAAKTYADMDDERARKLFSDIGSYEWWQKHYDKVH